MTVLQAEPKTTNTETSNAKKPAKPAVPTDEKRRWPKRLACAIVCFTFAIALLPTALNTTGYTNSMIASSMEDGTVVTSDSATIGWFSPLVAYGVQIKKPNQKEAQKIEKLEVNKSLFDIVRNKMKNATITLTKPKFRIVLNDGGKSAGALFPKMRTKVVDGELRVFELDAKEPILFLDKLNFTSDVRDHGKGRQMSMKSTTIIDRYKLTPEMTDHGLSLIAPMLANATDIEGSISLRIDEMKVNRVDSKSTLDTLRGSVTLHDVTSESSPVVSDMAEILGHVMGRSFPKRIVVARESVVKFYLKDERIFHDGLAFVLPDIAPDVELRSSGSVGFDQTLDITLSLIIPDSLGRLIPAVASAVGQSVQLRVTGTLTEPVVGLPENQHLADYIASRLVQTPGGNPEELPAAIVRLIEGVANPNRFPTERVQTLPGTIMNLIRTGREMRRKRIESGELPQRPRRRPRARRRRP